MSSSTFARCHSAGSRLFPQLEELKCIVADIDREEEVIDSDIADNDFDPEEPLEGKAYTIARHLVYHAPKLQILRLHSSDEFNDASERIWSKLTCLEVWRR